MPGRGRGRKRKADTPAQSVRRRTREAIDDATALNVTDDDSRLLQPDPGNFSYIGRLELTWSSNETKDTQILIIQETLTEAFQNSTIEDSGLNVSLKDLFVHVTTLELKEDTKSLEKDRSFNSTATFNLRMGEIVNISGIISTLNNAFGRGWISSKYSLRITGVHMYDDSENMLCKFTSNGSCNAKTTVCRQTGVSTQCVCKYGFEKTNDPTAKFCIDVDECKGNASAHLCSGLGDCENTDGGYTCKCNSGYTINASNSLEIACEDLDECNTPGYSCERGTCENGIGNWSCNCNGIGYLKTNITPSVYVCNDIDECSNASYYCGAGKCLNTVGSWNCSCPSGYNKLNVSQFNVTCEEIDECKEFRHNNTLETYCIKGLCSNLPGSWNCTCPDDRQWTKMPNGTYRCQGNYTYFGAIGLLTNINNASQIEQLMTDYVNALYKNTIVIETGNMELKLLFLSANVLNVTKENTMGEAVNITKLQKVLDESNKTFSLNGTMIIIYNKMIYEEDKNILCNLTNFGGCDPASTNCQQSNGTTHCVCKHGFEKHPDQSKFCYDINECARKETCSGHGKCINSIGNYTCNCESGYRLNTSDTNNLTCEDINECDANVNPCSEHGTCINTIGHYECNCTGGFKVIYTNKNESICADVNECTRNETCSGHGECINAIGNYTCNCDSGFRLNTSDTQNLACEDISECDANKNSCSGHGKCINTLGHYECNCTKGFKISYTETKDVVCTDIDECENETLCPDSKVCHNEPGYYTCQCAHGYEVNGSVCTDVDECSVNTTCLENSECVNAIGGYKCECNTGYTSLNDTYCQDVDECKNTSYFCGGNCSNTEGGWNCDCKSGYTKITSADNKRINCTDIDECAAMTCIGGFCKNTMGSWTCSCGEERTVKVINETTKTCSGGYQYVASLGFAVVASTTENIGDNPDLRDYFKRKITDAYNTSFSKTIVKVDILSIKRSGKVKRRARRPALLSRYIVQNRAASPGVSNWNVDFLLVFDEPVKQEKIESAWSDYQTKCERGDCQVVAEPQQFNIFPLAVQLKQDPATDLCDYYHYCDSESTNCEYLNNAITCTCKTGYIPKENTDAKCKVKENVCLTPVCENDAECKQNENSEGFECICLKGWSGKYCNVAQTLVGDSDHQTTILTAVGGSLGGVVIILLITIFVVCRWRGRKVKEAEKIALKNVDNNGFKPFDGSLYDDRYIGDSQNNSLERHSSTRMQQPNGTPLQTGYRLSTANLYATPHKLHRQTIHGSMIDLTNGHADHAKDEQRRFSIQDPQRHIASNMGWSYTANITRPVSLNGDILRKHPQADYDRPPSPQPDYHRNERLDAARDSGMGVGYNRNGSLSNDYRRSDPLKRNSYDGPNGETRF